MIDRFQRRFGRTSRNVVVALAYDTARAVIHGIGNAAMATPEAVKGGLERVRWMPATNGGPGTYIQFGPWDRHGEQGDFLTIRELRGGKRFHGYHRPQAVSLQPHHTGGVRLNPIAGVVVCSLLDEPAFGGVGEHVLHDLPRWIAGEQVGA